MAGIAKKNAADVVAVVNKKAVKSTSAKATGKKLSVATKSEETKTAKKKVLVTKTADENAPESVATAVKEKAGKLTFAKTTAKKLSAAAPRSARKKAKSVESVEKNNIVSEPEKENQQDHSEPPRLLQKNILTPEKKKKFRQILLKERERYENVQAYHREHALRSRKDVIDSNSTIMTHMADAGSDVFQQTFNLNMLTSENDVLQMVDEALDRLEDGHYGVCLLCGKLIPEARLEAKPYARFCVKCKARMEQLEGPESRHR